MLVMRVHHRMLPANNAFAISTWPESHPPAVPAMHPAGPGRPSKSSQGGDVGNTFRLYLPPVYESGRLPTNT